MAMTPDEKRAYQRGYQRGAHWPDHKPPLPPDYTVARLMEAAKELADAVRGQLATLCEDDEWQKTLGDPLDVVDGALENIGKWLKSKDAT